MKWLTALASLALVSHAFCDAPAAKEQVPAAKDASDAAAKEDSAAAKKDTTGTPEVSDATLNDAGEMVMFTGRARAGQKAPEMTLRDDYGLIIWNVGTYEAPVAEFVLAERKTKKKTTCDTLESFRTVLAKLPKGTRLFRYNTCTAGTSPGVWKTSPDKQVEQLCKKIGLRYDPFGEKWSRGFCTCP